MSPRSKRPDDDLLDLPFDAPLDGGSRSDGGGEGEDPSADTDAPANLPLFGAEPGESGESAPVADEVAPRTASVPDAPEPVGAEEEEVTAVARWLSGSVDVLIHGGVLAAVLMLLFFGFGVEPRPRQWPGYLLFALSFSFLYVTLPLAFWGQTPGMAWLRLQTRDHDNRPMTFGQTVVQWAVGLGTAILLGLPLFLTSGGRSLADRLTGAVTHRFPVGD